MHETHNESTFCLQRQGRWDMRGVWGRLRQHSNKVRLLLADVVAVNGKPAKGIFMTRQSVVNPATSPSAGQALSDVVQTIIVDRIIEIQQPEGTGRIHHDFGI